MNIDTETKKLEDILCVYFRGKTPTHTQIVSKAEDFAKTLFSESYDAFDFDKIVEYVECLIPITSYEAECLIDYETESDGWLTENLFENNAKTASRRYAQYLRQNGMAEDTITKIELNAKRVLSFCANPGSSQRDKKRGLVVGDVQAGKTANYIELINLACDFGYKIIVLLAGLTDSLREQTQIRIDEGFIGAKSETISEVIDYIGVGEENKDYYAIPLTNTKKDFLKFIKENINATPEGYSKPLILVVKKNAKVLNQIESWLKPENKGITSTNILIIDDEADNASVNTKKSEDDPTIINRCIRKIFDNFSVASYVGFTATPFANIFINPDNVFELESLFPSDFIIQLRPPSNYFGAKKVFGSKRHLRVLDEHETYFLPAIHQKTTHFNALPESMKEAVCSFLLACCVRTLRGHVYKHRSMLINISRFNSIHEEIRFAISQYVDELKNLITQDSYKTTSCFIRSQEANRLYSLYTCAPFFEDARKEYSFDDIKNMLIDEIVQFKIAVINNANTKNRFKYSDFSDVGARVIVIGGFVLSRGLTLEGLMVSYYSRAAAAYDSLLQMCRWFGYRTGYEDLCVVYMSQINIDNFNAVIDAVDDLKEQFAEMALKRKKPREFGLMVKESPNTLETAIFVTSRNKMYHTKLIEIRLSYGGEVVDTSKISRNHADSQYNTDRNIEFFSELQKKGFYLQRKNERLMFTDVPKDCIAAFVSTLRIHDMNRKFNKQCLADYIGQSQLFPFWDIVIPHGRSKKTLSFCGETINVPYRSCETRENENFIRVAMSQNRLIDPGILDSGLSSSDIEELIRLCNGRKPSSSKDYLQLQTRKPLLVIYPVDLQKDDISIDDNVYMGYALAFPCRGKSEKTTLRANKIKCQELVDAQLEDVDGGEEINND